MPPTPVDRPIVPGVPLVGTDLLRLAVYFARKLAPEHLRLDAASAFVLGALKAAPLVRLDGNPRAFLVSAGVHGLLTYLKRERRQRAASIDEGRGAADDSLSLVDTLPDKRTPRPDARMIARETAAVVRATVDSLPARQRVVAVKVLLGDRPVADVAAEVGKTQQCVYHRLGQTRRRLRHRLANCAT